MAYYTGQQIPRSAGNVYDYVDTNPDYRHRNQRTTTTRIPPEHTYDRLADSHPQPENFQSFQPVRYPEHKVVSNNRHKTNNHRPNEIIMQPMDIQQPSQSHKATTPTHPRREAWTSAQPAKRAKDVKQREPKNRVSPQRTRSTEPRAKRSEVGVCTKHTLFVTNFLVLIIGIGLTSLGAYILHMKEKKVRDVLDFLLDPSCDMCLVGSIFLFMGFIGLVGSLRENTFFLKAHYGLMVVFLLIQLGVVILVFVAYYSSAARDTIFPTDSFRDAIRKYRDDIDMQNLIDGMQRGLHCCGMSDSEQGFMDWNDNRYFTCVNNTRSPESCSVPASCCKQLDGQIQNHQCGWKVFKVEHGELRPNEEADLSTLNQLGCLKALADWVDKHALVVGGVLLGIILPQIFQVILTSSLIRMIFLQRLRWL